MASLASSRLNGSIFDEPTVAQWPVDDRDLGMHEAFFVLENPDSGSQRGRVERLRGVTQQRVVGLALQQHDDAHPAARCRIESVRETKTGKEIGVGDQDFLARRVDGLHVGMEDVVAVADIVADQEGGCLRTDGRGAGRRHARLPEAALEVGPRNDFPHMPDGMMDLMQDGAFEAHGIIETGAHAFRRIVVIDDVDAADEGDAAIDDHQFAMQAAQAVATQAKAREFRAGRP